MTTRYYAHRSLGFIDDYFGYIGPKVRVSVFLYYIMKLFRYRVTKIKCLRSSVD